jgi:hypothetical protein
MKYIILLLALTGCAAGSSWNASMGHPKPEYVSTDGTQTILLDKQVQEMTRNEVIMAIQDCEGNGLRAVIQTTKRRINGFASDIVFNVTCAPRLRFF